MKTEANEPINPVTTERELYDPSDPDDLNIGLTVTDYHTGITIRQYFAAMAMQGLLASPQSGKAAVFADQSVQMADALIHALNSTTT